MTTPDHWQNRVTILSLTLLIFVRQIVTHLKLKALRKLFSLLTLLIAVADSCYSYAQQIPQSTQVILLGTGTPTADPERSGPSLAIIVNNTSYIVDCGPGVVRRAGAAAAKYHLPSLRPAGLTHLFITHLHSDHTIGYPDFILTPAVLRRNGPLEVYGPKGIQSMTDYLLKATRKISTCG